MSKFIFLNVAAVVLLTSCASSTQQGAVGVNRRQLLIVPEEQVVSLSVEAYDQTKAEAQKKGVLDKNPKMLQRLQKIANSLIPHVSQFRNDALDWKWEVHVITSDELNAFCMPGGKIMFYTGIVEKLSLTDGEIAAIMGHEMAHALREHGRERMSEEMIKNVGFQLALMSGQVSEQTAGLANQVAAIAVTLPHSRKHETEADILGLELMARAGFNPEEAVNLWKKMGAAGGSKPPEILSTHPSDATRIKDLQKLIPKVMPLYQQAQKYKG